MLLIPHGRILSAPRRNEKRAAAVLQSPQRQPEEISCNLDALRWDRWAESLMRRLCQMSILTLARLNLDQSGTPDEGDRATCVSG
jgi:hypothetical protein